MESCSIGIYSAHPGMNWFATIGGNKTWRYFLYWISLMILPGLRVLLPHIRLGHSWLLSVLCIASMSYTHWPTLTLCIVCDYWYCFVLGCTKEQELSRMHHYFNIAYLHQYYCKIILTCKSSASLSRRKVSFSSYLQER